MIPQNGQAFYQRYDVLTVEELEGVSDMSSGQLFLALALTALKFGYDSIPEFVADLNEREASFDYTDTVLDGAPTVPNSSRFPTVAAFSELWTTNVLDPSETEPMCDV